MKNITNYINESLNIAELRKNAYELIKKYAGKLDINDNIKKLIDKMKADKNKKVGLLNEQVLDVIRFAIKYGYILQDNKKYGISKENIVAVLMTGGDITSTEAAKSVQHCVDEGLKFKYETDAEWKKDGLLDPFED